MRFCGNQGGKENINVQNEVTAKDITAEVPAGVEKTDEEYMSEALREAENAAELGEVPVGCVIVRDGKVIARAGNRRENGKCALDHAEIIAIEKACRSLGGWRLPGCTLYVTWCPMCAGAIINARIPRVVFGAYDKKAGAFGSVVDLNAYPFNHHPEIISGVSEGECASALSGFFKKKTQKLKMLRSPDFTGAIARSGIFGLRREFIT
ncbi:MAG: nucleoside deaminase [Lachnospiraceae bacterium]